MTRYFIFHDNGQIMAVQSSPNPPDKTSWEDRGYIRQEVSKAEFLQLDRNTSITTVDDMITNIEVKENPIQPTLSPEEERIGFLISKEATVGLDADERWEYIKLRDNLG